MIEVLVGVVILSLALLGLAAAGSVAFRQMFTGRTDMGLWSAVQQQVEVLLGQGYKNVQTDSALVQAYPMRWTVTGTDPKKLVLEVRWRNQLQQVSRDTLVLYFASRDTL